MNLDMNLLPKQVLAALKAKARKDKIPISDVAITLLSDHRMLERLCASADVDTPSGKRAIRREELLDIVPLGASTIYRMELRGEFPSRFYLTPRCAAWDFDEVMEWLENRQAKTKREKRNRNGFPGIGDFNENHTGA